MSKITDELLEEIIIELDRNAFCEKLFLNNLAKKYGKSEGGIIKIYGNVKSPFYHLKGIAKERKGAKKLLKEETHKIMKGPLNKNDYSPTDWNGTVSHLVKVDELMKKLGIQRGQNKYKLENESQHIETKSKKHLFTKEEIEIAASQTPLGIRGNIDLIINQVGENALAAGKILDDNWRADVEKLIEEWFIK